MPAQILIVDDDSTLVELLRLYFRRRGFEIVAASTGAEGLARARQAQPDLVFLDVFMPDDDGWQVCRQLREVCRAPVVIVTDLARDEDIRRGLQAGAADYVTKPFSLRVLEQHALAVMHRAGQRAAPHATAGASAGQYPSAAIAFPG